MANIKFNVDKGYLFVIYYPSVEDRFKMSLREKVDPKMWDNKNQRVKPIHPHSLHINNFLNTIKDHIDKIRLEYKTAGKRVTSMDLRKELNQRIYGVDEMFVAKFWPQWLENKDIKPGTRRAYKNCLIQIEKRFPSLKFTDINKRWYDTYLKSTTNLKTNYKYKILKVFKDVIHSAHVEGIHTNLFYQSSLYQLKTEAVDHIYLRLDDINKIYDFINTSYNTITKIDKGIRNDDNRLRNAAIIFLIGCLSGQRHQTYSLLNKSMITISNDVKMISIMTAKTTTRVSIPLSAKLERLLDMDSHHISQQKLNNYIKEVCKLCNIDHWDQVTSHTARRTFATNAVLAGIDISYIMKITGHKTEKEFRKYVKMDDILSAEKVSAEIRQLFA